MIAAVYGGRYIVPVNRGKLKASNVSVNIIVSFARLSLVSSGSAIFRPCARSEHASHSRELTQILTNGDYIYIIVVLLCNQLRELHKRLASRSQVTFILENKRNILCLNIFNPFKE